MEKWTLKNGAGGWTHPIHIHLVDFQIVSRVGGKRPVLPYEKVALKDVVWLNTNEEVNVIARYAPWDGLYMVKATRQKFRLSVTLTSTYSSTATTSSTKITR